MRKSENLSLPEDVYKVSKSIFIVAQPEKVFEVITRSEHWDKYFTTGMEMDPVPGGVMNFKWKNFGPHLVNRETPGRVIEITPPTSLVFEWGQPGFETTARMSLESYRGGTILSLYEDGYPTSTEGLASILECSAHWGELLALIKFYAEYGITYRSPLDVASENDTARAQS